MTDTPNRPPLWEVMADAFDKAAPAACFYGTGMLARCKAAEIRALRDWLVPEEKQPPQRKDTGGWNSWHDKLCWDEHQRLHAQLTTEADRAERGDG